MFIKYGILDFPIYCMCFSKQGEAAFCHCSELGIMFSLKRESRSVNEMMVRRLNVGWSNFH